MTLRERVKELANNKGLSLPNLESELGFGSGTIVKWDKSTPNVDKLKKVADYFGVSIDYLVTGKEPDKEKNGMTDQEKRLMPYMKKWAAKNVDPERIDELFEMFDKMMNEK